MLGEGTHPEFLAQKKCIDERLEAKVRLADAQYRYSMEALRISTKVNRAQVHSQYFQQTRQLREDALYGCSELWYAIQRERRASETLVPGEHFPSICFAPRDYSLVRRDLHSCVYRVHLQDTRKTEHQGQTADAVQLGSENTPRDPAAHRISCCAGCRWCHRR